MSAPRLTTKQKHAILKDYEAGLPLKVIADRHGVAVSYPSLLADRRGLPRRSNGYSGGSVMILGKAAKAAGLTLADIKAIAAERRHDPLNESLSE